MQLKSYGRYLSTDHFEQDDSVRTYAICESELEPTYYYLHKGKKEYGVFFFFIATMVLPILLLMLTSTVVRSLHKSIHVRIIRTSHHQNVTGLVLTGTFVMFYIVACDICAVYYAYIGYNEVSQFHHLKGTLNYISTAVLLAFDGLVGFIPLTVLLYVCCKHVDEYTHDDDRPDDEQSKCNKCVRCCCLGCCLHQGLKLYFNAVFGTLKLKELWEVQDENVKRFRLVWVITLSLVAPLFAISCHATFILASWLTNKSQASSVALICLAVLTYLFFMLRQCYTALNASKRLLEFPVCLIPLYPFYQCFKHVGACFYLSCCCDMCRECRDRVEEGDELINDRLVERNVVQPREDQHNEFNTRAFCVAFMWGWVLVGIVGLLILAFMLLPIVAFDLLTDLINTFQILLILIGLLITYKILNLSEPDVYRFLNKMRDAFLTKSGNRDVSEEVSDYQKVDDIEATGYLVGELAEVVVHKYE